jgi:hypothetical protein
MPPRLTDPHEIFETCLRDVRAGKVSVEECVRRYPEFTALGALLRSALALRSLSAERMDAAQREALERRLRAAYALHVRPAPRWLLRTLAIAAVLGIAIGIGALLTVASLSSLPNEPLYGLKRAVENLAASLSGDSPEVLAAHARERLQELEFMVARGDSVPPELLDAAAESLQRALKALPEGAERDALRRRGAETFQFVARLRAESRETALRLAQAFSPTPDAPTQEAIAVQPSATPTPTLTRTPTFTATPSETPTLTLTLSATRTLTPTPTETPTALTIIIPLPTQLPSETPTPSPTAVPPTRTPTPTLPTAAPPFVSPVPLPSLTPTATPLILPSVVVQPTVPPVLPTDTLTWTPVPPTDTPTSTPMPPTDTPTSTPTLPPVLPTDTPDASQNAPDLNETPTLTPTPTLPPCDPNAPPPPLRFNAEGTPLPTFTPTPCATYTPTPTLEISPTPSGDLEKPVETPSTS